VSVAAASLANLDRTEHGHWKDGKRSPTYVSWQSMCARCYREKHPRYEDYGGRGVTVYAGWRGRGGFARFLEHVGERPADRTLDRIDPNGNYEPGNVRSATKQQQRWNRRDMAHRSPPWEQDDTDTDTDDEEMPF
jgi:hypothetical protein